MARWEDQAMVQRILAYLATVLAVTILVAAVGAQITLNALGVPVTLADRMNAAAADIMGAGPTLAIFFAPLLLVLLVIAGLAVRYALFRRLLLFGLAGAGAVGLVLVILGVAFPMPVLASARTIEGAQALAAAGFVGGLVYAFLGPRSRREG
jgi:hypothetical protein